MEGYRRGERALAVYLSSITGFIDALGFLYLGGFFLSFMESAPRSKRWLAKLWRKT